MAAVFSTEVDTCDAILFMISTSASKDLYKRYLKPAASDADLLRVARIAAVIGGTCGVLLSIYLTTVIGALTIFYSLLGVSLFVPVIGGLYTKHAGSAAAMTAIIVGVGTLLVVEVRIRQRISMAGSNGVRTSCSRRCLCRGHYGAGIRFDRPQTHRDAVIELEHALALSRFRSCSRPCAR